MSLQCVRQLLGGSWVKAVHRVAGLQDQAGDKRHLVFVTYLQVLQLLQAYPAVGYVHGGAQFG